MTPLNFADQHFDLIFNHSVVTHLDEKYQDAWLAELHRVTKPGGILLLTVSGEHPFVQLEKSWQDAGADTALLRRTFAEKGIGFYPR
jgi:ubiquinone/menaquinone biosynthesis C-methylase UbiE